jgi:hypothetical protein
MPVEDGIEFEKVFVGEDGRVAITLPPEYAICRRVQP